jgi:hypothetical protein
MKIWAVILLVWIAWKVVGSILEEIAQRKRKQEPKLDARKVPQPSRAQRIPRILNIPGRQKTYSASEDQPENELERLLREAMLQKRRQKMGKPLPSASALPSQLPSTMLSPSAAKPASTADRNLATIQDFIEDVPPVPARPRLQTPPAEHPVAHKQVARKVRQAVPEPRVARPVTASEVERKVRVRQGQVSAEHAPSVAHPLLEMLGRKQIRRSIVVAEILGPPKGLGHIDSHYV